jgi:hypothetical protein
MNDDNRNTQSEDQSKKNQPQAGLVEASAENGDDVVIPAPPTEEELIEMNQRINALLSGGKKFKL